MAFNHTGNSGGANSTPQMGLVSHTLHKPANNVTRQALKWNPQVKRNRGRPRAIWHRSTEQKLKGIRKILERT